MLLNNSSISTILAYMLANDPVPVEGDLSAATEALIKAGAGPFMARFLIGTSLVGLANELQEASVPESFKEAFATEVARVLDGLLPPPGQK